MKYLIVITTLCISLAGAGYLLGKYTNKRILSETACNCHEPTVIDPATVDVQHNELREKITCEQPVDEENFSGIDIETQLVSENDDDRMDALFYIWRTNLVEDFSPEIEKIAKADTNQYIVTFAQWIVNSQLMTESINSKQPEIVITDYENIEDQLKGSLVEDIFQFAQTDGKLPSPNQKDILLDTLYQLPEEEQIAYINDLSRSQEDAAIEALFEVVSHYNPNLKHAAIEELLTQLANRTGHFDIITEGLKKHQNDLSDDQQQRFAILSTENQQEVSGHTLETIVELEMPY